METFIQLFATMILFVYQCFDRVVINGYLSVLTRPQNVVYFFRQVIGVRCITKEVLARRTGDYQRWVEAFARNHDLPLEWAEKGVRKEDSVCPYLRRMERTGRFGVYFIFKSMEQGPSFRSVKPKYETADPDYRRLHRQKNRYTHYYFYIRDHVLGPIAIRVASFLPFQTTYWLNGHSFVERELERAGVPFRKHDNAFLRCADPQALQAAADRLSPERIRQRLDYWTLIVGPKFSRRERAAMNLSRFYAVGQVEYCRNFIFRRHFPLRRLFERSCELGLWRLTADKISRVFGQRLTRRHKGKLATTLEHIGHGAHVLRAYFKNAFVKQYEKFLTFLRQEVCSNNLKDFALKKGLEHLGAVREKFAAILDRFAQAQAASFNVHVDDPLLQRLARPVLCGRTKIPGLKIHETRMIRLMEVLLHAGLDVGGWRTAQIHQVILEKFALEAGAYSLTQLRYDLRKLKAHGLLERDGRAYRYRLTSKGRKVCLLFVLFHKRVCGPLAGSLFVHRPNSQNSPASKLEMAYHKADQAIDEIVNLLAAA